jgi:UrcA family protein
MRFATDRYTRRKAMLRVLGISLAAMTVLASAANAGQDYNTIRQDVSVGYGDLNLSTEAGAHTMLIRINQAAQKACGGAPIFYGTYNVAPELARKDFATCQTNAVSAAVKMLNAPLVMRLYAQNGEEALRIAGR